MFFRSGGKWSQQAKLVGPPNTFMGNLGFPVALQGERLSVILSEQNLHFASLVAGKVVIIEKGRVRFAGTMDALRADPAISEQYLSV